MALRIKTKLMIKGMTCTQCEKIIQKTLSKHAGIYESTVNYKTSSAEIIYDSEIISLKKVIALIENKGYEALEIKGNDQVKKISPLQFTGVALLILALYGIISNTIGFNVLPEVQSSMGYGMLFLVGLLTSVHCIAMCGGINLTQSIKPIVGSGTKDIYKSSLGYNAGRVLSYTIIGGIVGSLGSVITFTGASRGLVSLLAGSFMILMGINMLGVFPSLKKISIQMPNGLREIFVKNQGKRGPFIVGMLNGLMPCGPLQTMQLYALGTGSAVTGAISMFAFSLGTVPLMFGFGALSTLLSKNFTKKMMKVSAVLVIVLGMVMFQRGASLSGISSANFESSAPSIKKIQSTSTPVDGVQVLNLEVARNGYPEFVIQKNIPTKINFYVTNENLTGCNNAIVIPKYGIEIPLVAGDNWIEFTPTTSGTFPYSCWMGMIRSKFTVID